MCDITLPDASKISKLRFQLRFVLMKSSLRSAVLSTEITDCSLKRFEFRILNVFRLVSVECVWHCYEVCSKRSALRTPGITKLIYDSSWIPFFDRLCKHIADSRTSIHDWPFDWSFLSSFFLVLFLLSCRILKRLVLNSSKLNFTVMNCENFSTFYFQVRMLKVCLRIVACTKALA